MMLVAAQPLIGAHFCQDGLENEGEIHVRSAGTPVELETDADADRSGEIETTLFVPAAASIDLPQLLEQGIARLLILVLLLLPLAVAIVPVLSAFRNAFRRRVPSKSAAAPPPTAPWRRLPPETAPPCPN